MGIHTPGHTFAVFLLVLGTLGLGLPVLIGLRLIDKVSAHSRHDTVALCDCCGAYREETTLTTYTLDETDYKLCAFGKYERVTRGDALESALKTPLSIKYLAPTA